MRLLYILLLINNLFTSSLNEKEIRFFFNCYCFFCQNDVLSCPPHEKKTISENYSRIFEFRNRIIWTKKPQWFVLGFFRLNILSFFQYSRIPNSEFFWLVQRCRCFYFTFRPITQIRDQDCGIWNSWNHVVNSWYVFKCNANLLLCTFFAFPICDSIFHIEFENCTYMYKVRIYKVRIGIKYGSV